MIEPLRDLIDNLQIFIEDVESSDAMYELPESYFFVADSFRRVKHAMKGKPREE
jgi:hypothetical protein